jgi:hypothetical protein
MYYFDRANEFLDKYYEIIDKEIRYYLPDDDKKSASSIYNYKKKIRNILFKVINR